MAKPPFSSSVDGIFFKTACHLTFGDVVRDSDGFLWKVVDLPNRTLKMVTIALEPVFASMTARGRLEKKFRRQDSVCCASVNEESLALENFRRGVEKERWK